MASLGKALSGLAAQSASLLATRIELFSLEAQEAQARLLQDLAVLLLAVFCLLAAFTVATVAIILCLWPTDHRTLALGLIALAYAAAAAGLLAWLRWRLRRATPFAATRQVLLEDAHSLHGHGGARRHPASDGNIPPAPGHETAT